MSLTANAATHAITHCHITTTSAHFLPSSRFTDAIAATQGVYSSENTSIEPAASDDIYIFISSPKSISIVDTTLSLAINPLNSETIMRQSPSPSGSISGSKRLAAPARILSSASLTILRCVSKLWRNHTTTVAMSITENARWRKSFAFSQRS